MAVTVETAFQALTYIKKNINNLSPANRLQMANIVNSRIYDHAMNINPEDYIVEDTIFIDEEQDEYDLPDDFLNHVTSPRVGIFKKRAGTRFLALEFDTQTGAFTVGETITGGTSGATGVIDQIQDDGTTGWLKLSSVTDDFQDNEAITGDVTGAAVVNGSPISYEESDDQLVRRHKASEDIGYYTTSNKIIFTPLPLARNVYLNRYLPTLDQFTDETYQETFLAVNANDGKYVELIRNLLLIEYEIFDQNPLLEQNADVRADNLLTEFFNSINKEPLIYIFDA